jgi:hypothetical protein
VLREEGVQQTEDGEQEEHRSGEVAHRGGQVGLLTEDAEAVGGEQQTAQGLGPQQGVDSQLAEVVDLLLGSGDVFFRAAIVLQVGDTACRLITGLMVE